MLQHSWRGLARLSPSAFSEGVRKLQELESWTHRYPEEGGRGGGQLQTWGEARSSREGRGGFATSEEVCKSGGVGGFKRVLNALRLDSLGELYFLGIMFLYHPLCRVRLTAQRIGNSRAIDP